ncbi:MAG TPA: acetylglutamate kinase [Candidatus Binatia bacterium]|nr:acetylglutamate kinase [Candidatus Binatia bacterium]
MTADAAPGAGPAPSPGPEPGPGPESRAASASVVVKLGGETLADQHDTLRGVAALAPRHRALVVHGGGKRLSAWLDRLGIESSWEAGRRVTDDAALEVAVAVLRGLVNAELVAALARLGVRAVGLSGVDAGLLVAERVPGLGRVARVTGARLEVLDQLLAAGLVPVVAPLALDSDGAICNVNADEVAAGLAAAMRARLLLLSDTDGVLDAAGRPIRRLDRARAEALIADGTIEGGMIPKVRGALAVAEAGAPEVVIADGRSPDAVARALADETVGTRVVAGP